MANKKTILVCPLDWGLGHATRDVSLIKREINNGHKVIIGASGKSLTFLKQEFPDLDFIEFSGHQITYAKKPWFLLWILILLPGFAFSILKEHYKLRRIITEYKITTVISDNRYGLWHKNVQSILITHQLFIKLPNAIKWIEPLVHWLTRLMIQKFDECWVPDYEKIENSLAGKLSHGKKIPNNVKYIGPLSRFQNFVSSFSTQKIPNVLVIISGPEPHRTLFENEIEERFLNSNQSVLMVCGKPGIEIKKTQSSNIKKVSHLQTQELGFYLQNCKSIISRSGYSTIMDLHIVNRTAELSATPGQTEQEYLMEWQINNNK